MKIKHLNGAYFRAIIYKKSVHAASVVVFVADADGISLGFEILVFELNDEALRISEIIQLNTESLFHKVFDDSSLRI